MRKKTKVDLNGLIVADPDDSEMCLVASRDGLALVPCGHACSWEAYICAPQVSD